MSRIVEIPAATLMSDSWTGRAQAEALAELENSNVIFVPGLSLQIHDDEKALLDPKSQLSDGVQKNITLDPYLHKTSGVNQSSPYVDAVNRLLARYKSESLAWLEKLFGERGRAFEPQRTTFRPVEIKSRAKLGKVGDKSQYRFDDTRLHADAFIRRPMVNRRILRVFNNINPFGEPRVWNVGGDFGDYARRYLDKIRAPYPGEFALLNLLRRTHWKRSHYDHIMIHLHDLGKLDDDFQANSPQTRVEFPPNSVWLCFTDSVLHAALAGRYALEQTFETTIEQMADPAKSPQRRLETIKGINLL
ncbi:MAG: Kdo hydroxylase family protein [Parvibaculaceae bacterium]